MLEAIGNLHHVATINTTLVQAYIRSRAALCSIFSLPEDWVEDWREVFMSLCYCAGIWSTFWVRHSLELSLCYNIRNYGLEGRLEWFEFVTSALNCSGSPFAAIEKQLPAGVRKVDVDVYTLKTLKFCQNWLQS